MDAIRNSVKAIILQNGKILFNKSKAANNGEIFYTLPGGGQRVGETFLETLERECMEELGAKISIGDLVLVREYLGNSHEYSQKHDHVHQIEFMFLCKLISLPDNEKAVYMDKEQISVEWVDVTKLSQKAVFPSVLKEVFGRDGNIQAPVYMGDVN